MANHYAKDAKPYRCRTQQNAPLPGATERVMDDEIEVTDEMVEAGVEEAHWWDSRDDLAMIVSQIYKAMETRRRSPSPSPASRAVA